MPYAVDWYCTKDISTQLQATDVPLIPTTKYHKFKQQRKQPKNAIDHGAYTLYSAAQSSRSSSAMVLAGNQWMRMRDNTTHEQRGKHTFTVTTGLQE